MNKGFILKALFLLCFLFSQTAQAAQNHPPVMPEGGQIMRVYACGHWRKTGASACLYC